MKSGKGEIDNQGSVERVLRHAVAQIEVGEPLGVPLRQNIDFLVGLAHVEGDNGAQCSDARQVGGLEFGLTLEVLVDAVLGGNNHFVFLTLHCRFDHSIDLR